MNLRFTILCAALLAAVGCSQGGRSSSPATVAPLTNAPATARIPTRRTREQFLNRVALSSYNIPTSRTPDRFIPFDASWSAFNPPPAAYAAYNAQSPFNGRVPANPALADNSDAVIAFNLNAGSQRGSIEQLSIGFSDESQDYYHPIYFAKSGDPLYTVHCAGFQAGDRCSMEGYRIAIPDGAQPAGGTDHHLAVIETQTGREYDFFDVERIGNFGAGNEIDVTWVDIRRFAATD